MSLVFHRIGRKRKIWNNLPRDWRNSPSQPPKSLASSDKESQTPSIRFCRRRPSYQAPLATQFEVLLELSAAGCRYVSTGLIAVSFDVARDRSRSEPSDTRYKSQHSLVRDLEASR